MSRSKKQPWLKDHNPKGRTIHHRRMRTMTRNILQHYLQSSRINDPLFRDPRSVTNCYDIIDWRWYIDKPENRRK